MENSTELSHHVNVYYLYLCVHLHTVLSLEVLTAKQWHYAVGDDCSIAELLTYHLLRWGVCMFRLSATRHITWEGFHQIHFRIAYFWMSLDLCTSPSEQAQACSKKCDQNVTLIHIVVLSHYAPHQGLRSGPAYKCCCSVVQWGWSRSNFLTDIIQGCKWASLNDMKLQMWTLQSPV